jgi:hypothetical protein
MHKIQTWNMFIVTRARSDARDFHAVIETTQIVTKQINDLC